jgi:hypothetical protein
MKASGILPAILLVVAMIAVAEHTGQKEVIFPEIAALALGAWIMKKQPWQSANLHFWLSPTLAAFTGVLLFRLFPHAPFFMTIGAFCLVALQLKLLNSTVLPSISAAVLPIITSCESWYYPLSVCLLTGAIAIGRRLMNNDGQGHVSTGTGRVTSALPTANPWTLPELAHWAKLLAGVIIATGIAVGLDLLFIVAPPLIVAFVELSKPRGALRDKGGKALVLLASAAFAGVFWLQLVHKFLAGPVWLSAAASTATVFLLFHALRMPFPPAVALALLPTILPESSILSYPWQVFAGSAAFIALSRICLAEGTPLFGRTKEETSLGKSPAD